jgi:signal transduction histidine kinase
VKLSRFITARLEDILAEWESFARTQQPEGSDMSPLALRDHAKPILQAIALDMDTAQTPGEQKRKSQGLADEDCSVESAASTHGTLRQLSGFSLIQLNAEFRALRATVLRLWLPTLRELDEDSTRDMVRFNETIDQALAESIVTYNDKALRSRDTFLAILGHDLRSPLQTIAVAGDYLGRPGIGSAETREVAARVRRSVATIDAMVRDLLEYARGQLGNAMPLQASLGDLGVLCTSVVGDLGATWPDCKFELALEGDLAGCFDRHRIEQALTNLLTNAMQYRGPGCSVKVIAADAGEALELRVANFGSVIPANALEAIFDPMVQLAAVPGQAGRPSTSLGLGLYIARQIAQSHQGTLNASSSEAEGTVFSLRLPRTGPQGAKAA